jgi:hypothetical protein
MKQTHYDRDDERWGRVAQWEDHHNQRFKAPNGFMHILLDNFDKIKQLRDIDTVIETGTFEGQTSEIFSESFNYVHTVEKFLTNNSYSDKDFISIYKKLKKEHPNISFYSGDSSLFLSSILPDINKQSVILLDAHTSTHTPLVSELTAIKESSINNHVIMIDDCIDMSSNHWPSQAQFEELIKDINSNYKIVNTKLFRDVILVYEEE